MKDLLKKILSSIGLVFVVALLGSIAGQGPKELRRFVLPAVVTIYAFFTLHNIWLQDVWLVTIYFMSGVLSLGYGVPSFNGPNGTMDDEGSAIGAFFYKITKSERWANILSRSTIGILISLSMLSVPILIGTWLSFFIGSAMIIAIWASVSWRGFGETPIKLFGKEYRLLNVDLVCYGVTALGFVIIIQGFFK
jgi:hypothetical protein